MSGFYYMMKTPNYRHPLSKDFTLYSILKSDLSADYVDVRPLRHPEHGLCWTGKNYVSARDSWVCFFNEPDMLVQELIAAEMEEKERRKT